MSESAYQNNQILDVHHHKCKVPTTNYIDHFDYKVSLLQDKIYLKLKLKFSGKKFRNFNSGKWQNSSSLPESAYKNNQILDVYHHKCKVLTSNYIDHFHYKVSLPQDKIYLKLK